MARRGTPKRSAGKRNLTSIQRTAHGVTRMRSASKRNDLLFKRIIQTENELARLNKLRQYFLARHWKELAPSTRLHDPKLERTMADPVYKALSNYQVFSAMRKIRDRKMGRKEYLNWARALKVDLPREEQ